MRWPGTAVLLPTLGAGLIILAGRPSSFLTCTKAAQWLGARSYSIYLWHWPLVVLLVYFDQQHSPVLIGAVLLVALLLGHLSYRWVEVPAQGWLTQKYRVRGAVWLVACLAVVAVSAQMVRRSGFPDRLPDAVARIEAERNNRNLRIEECLEQGAPCTFGGTQIRALVIGDSHADAVITAVEASLPSTKQGVYFRGMHACLMVLAAHRISDEKGQAACRSLRDELAGELETLYPGRPLIVVNRTSFYVLGELPIPGVNHPGQPAVYFFPSGRDAHPRVPAGVPGAVRGNRLPACQTSSALPDAPGSRDDGQRAPFAGSCDAAWQAGRAVNHARRLRRAACVGVGGSGRGCGPLRGAYSRSFALSVR